MQIKTLILLVLCLPLTLSAKEALIAKGHFIGMSGHTAKGQLTISKNEASYIIKFADDFAFDGAPDPRLGFGQSKYLPTTEFAKLTHKKGTKTYTLPASKALENYKTFWIWCEAFSVPVGRVDLTM